MIEKEVKVLTALVEAHRAVSGRELVDALSRGWGPFGMFGRATWVYTTLARLQRYGYVGARWHHPCDLGRPQRFFRPTKAGELLVQAALVAIQIMDNQGTATKGRTPSGDWIPG